MDFVCVVRRRSAAEEVLVTCHYYNGFQMNEEN